MVVVGFFLLFLMVAVVRRGRVYAQECHVCGCTCSQKSSLCVENQCSRAIYCDVVDGACQEVVAPTNTPTPTLTPIPIKSVQLTTSVGPQTPENCSNGMMFTQNGCAYLTNTPMPTPGCKWCGSNCVGENYGG